MALFKKKLTLDEILAGIDALSDEEKAKIGEKMKDLYKAEDEREIDKIEAEKADDPEIAGEKSEDEREENEEIGKDVDEVEAEVEKDESNGAPEAPEGSEEPEEEAPEAAEQESEEDANDLADIRAEISELKKLVAALSARIDADAENEAAEEEPEEPAFGIGAGTNGAAAPEEDEVEQCRKKYFNF